MEEKERLRFQTVCEEICGHERVGQGVGTLKEKTIHAVLKNYYEPDIFKQEQRVEGFVADIFTGEMIIEVQTRNFNTMRRKLEAFLQKYPVTIVYPVMHRKWLRWINEETGEVSAPRKSPKTGSGHEIFREIYRLKMLLPNDRLSFKIALIDAVEYRVLNGWSENKKKGSTRNDGIPTDIFEEISLSSVEDFQKMIPEILPERFTSKDYRAALKSSRELAGTELNILAHLGAVEKVGKLGKNILYQRTKERK